MIEYLSGNVIDTHACGKRVIYCYRERKRWAKARLDRDRERNQKLTGFSCATRRAEHFECAFYDDSVRNILFTESLFREKQTFQIDGSNRNALELDGFCVRTERFICHAVGIEHDIHDKGIGDPNVFTFFEPGRFNLFGSVIGKNQQRIFDPLSRCSRGRNHNVDIRRRSLVSMRGESVATDQEIIDMMLMEGT